jgi:hypothetical protein
LEETCIKALAYDPTLVYYIDKVFRSFELACLHPDDFTHTDYKELFKLIKQGLEQDSEEPLNFIRERMPEVLIDAFLEQPVDEDYPDWRLQPDSPILEALLKQFIRLRRIRVDEGLEQIVFLQTQEGINEAEAPLDFRKIAMEFAQVRSKLDHALQQSFFHDKPKP